MEKLSVISSQTVIASDLEQLKAEFQAWRSQQTGRKIIPQYLWDKAFALLKTYPLNVVRRELNLNRERLLAYVKSTQLTQYPSNSQSNPNLHPTFLHLTPAEINLAASYNHNPSLIPSPKPTPEAQILPQPKETCRIVFEKSDGSRLSLQLSTNLSTIEAVCNSFLKG